MNNESFLIRQDCRDTDCPERIDCCTTVRWRISEETYRDRSFREWWLLHEGARLYEENGVYYMHWPMRCRNAADDGLSCTDYDNRPEVCRRYTCPYMAGLPVEKREEP